MPRSVSRPALLEFSAQSSEISALPPSEVRLTGSVGGRPGQICTVVTHVASLDCADRDEVTVTRVEQNTTILAH